jgi:hypothetical protein
MGPRGAKTSPTYWCQHHLVVTVQRDGEPASTVSIARPFARVGSHPSSDVLLRPDSSPRRGLYLHASEEGIFYVKLQRDGVGGEVGHGWLGEGETVRVGAYRISAGMPDAQHPPVRERLDWEAKRSIAGPHPVLVASAEGRALGRLVIARRLTVLGRHDPSTIRLASHSVSACHCVLYREADKLWVIDLLSGNGTRVDGCQIEAAELPPGCRLTLGRVRLDYTKQVDTVTAPRGRTIAMRGRRSEIGHSRSKTSTAADSPVVRLIVRGEEEPQQAIHRLEAARQAWQSERSRQQMQLAAERQQLDADASRLASQQAELAAERAAWEEQRRQEAARMELQAKAAARQAEQLQSEAAELARLWAEFQRRQEQAEAQHEAQARALAARLRQVEQEESRLAAEIAALDIARQAPARELAAPAAARQDIDRGRAAWKNEAAEVECAPAEQEATIEQRFAAPAVAVELRPPDEVADRALEALLAFRRSKTRWHRLKESLFSCLGKNR